MRHTFLPLAFFRAGSLALIALAATGDIALFAESSPSEPPLSPPLQTPVDIRSLPPGTMLAPGTIAAPGAIAAPRTSAPAGTVAAAAPAQADGDYWIVSSRRCGGRPSPSNTGCLNYFHRTADRQMSNVGRDAFLASVQPDQPVCFVVHGSYNRWNDVMTESRKINRWVRSGSPGAPLQVVFFTWPSDGNMPFLFPVDIAMLGRKASQHSFYLANLIGQLPPEQPVCLLGHSHGARSAVAALHLLGGGAIEDGQMLPPGHSTPRLRAVLIAAAIDSNWFNPGQRYSQALKTPEQVLLMRNSRDATLAIYPLRIGRGGRAMGRDGLARQDRFAMNQMGRKVVELDAADFAGMNHSFADYHERTELAAAIIPFVYFDGDSPPVTPADPISPAQKTETATTVRKPAPGNLGDPEPIAPARREPETSELPAATGPKLAPAVDSPVPDDEPPDTDPLPAADGTVKIYPRARRASQRREIPDSAGRGETGSAPSTPGDPRDWRRQPTSSLKKKIRYQLRLEP